MKVDIFCKDGQTVGTATGLNQYFGVRYYSEKNWQVSQFVEIPCSNDTEAACICVIDRFEQVSGQMIAHLIKGTNLQNRKMPIDSDKCANFWLIEVSESRGWTILRVMKEDGEIDGNLVKLHAEDRFWQIGTFDNNTKVCCQFKSWGQTPTEAIEGLKHQPNWIELLHLGVYPSGNPESLIAANSAYEKVVKAIQEYHQILNDLGAEIKENEGDEDYIWYEFKGIPMFPFRVFRMTMDDRGDFGPNVPVSRLTRST